MKDTDLKATDLKDPVAGSDSHRRGPCFARDQAGLLYEEGMRSAIAGAAGAMAPAYEAMAALTWAAKRIHQNLERHAEAHGLSAGRMQMLYRLKHHPRARPDQGVPLGELAEMLRVSPRNVTGLIDTLERDGLVARVPDPSDRRSVLARLTSQGQERIDAVWQGAMDAQAGLTEGFSDEELAQLRHLCLRLVERMERRAAKEDRA